MLIEKGDKMTTGDKVINYLSMLLGGLVGLTVGLIIYRRTMARAAELAAETALAEEAEEGEAGYEDGDTTLLDPDDAAVLMLDDDISLWDRQEEEYRDESEEEDDNGKDGKGRDNSSKIDDSKRRDSDV